MQGHNIKEPSSLPLSLELGLITPHLDPINIFLKVAQFLHLSTTQFSNRHP